MLLKKIKRVEEQLTIVEEDLINNGEVIVLIAYAIKENNNLWSYPSPQIYDETLYNKYKEKYDAEVIKFRQECEV